MTSPVPYESRVRPLIAAATPAPWVRSPYFPTEITDGNSPICNVAVRGAAAGWTVDNRALILTAVNTAAASADLAEAVRALTKAIVTARRFRAPDCDDETTIIPTPKWDAIMSAHMDAVAALSRLDAAGGA